MPVDKTVPFFRRRRERARRRSTAEALHALRHDREYLLGLLPPNATSQVKYPTYPHKQLPATAMQCVSAVLRDALHKLAANRATSPLTTQVLQLLDPVSLGSLRQASRQAYLLVSSSIKVMVMDLPDLIKYSQVPLEAVYPNLEVGEGTNMTNMAYLRRVEKH